MVATTLKKLPDEGSPGSFNYLTKKIKVTIYDNTLNPVVTKTSHFQLDINNI